MENVKISFRQLSEIAWQQILSATAFKTHYAQAEFFRKIDALDELRKKADYNTGSISSSSAWLLYSAAFYFRPSRILEIGTFIGKSTLSLAMGADDRGEMCEIHTCDVSNDIDLPATTRSKIVQYKKTPSTAMLKQISESGDPRQFDFVHLDGRVQREDIQHIRSLVHENAVIALDDFEGIEKGVANLMLFRENQIFPGHAVIYPCEKKSLRENNLGDISTTALLVPARTIQILPQ